MKIKAEKIPLLDKKIVIEWKNLFISFSKGITKYLAADSSSAIKESLDIFKSIRLKNELSEICFKLINEALINATHDLISNNKSYLLDSLQEESTLIDSDEYVKVLDKISEFLNKNEIYLTKEELEAPLSMVVLLEFKKFIKILLDDLRIRENDHIYFLTQFDTYFVQSLYRIWSENYLEFQKIYSFFYTNPIRHTLAKQLQWKHYHLSIKRLIQEPIFDESFGIKDIFVRLNGYFDIEQEVLLNGEKIKFPRKKVVDIIEFLDNWYNEKSIDKPIKILCGGPGSGKSTLLKIWSESICKKFSQRLLYIPLHLIDVRVNLVDAIDEFVKGDGFFNYNPLEEDSEQELLIIFDGLDELIKQGKYGENLALEFIREVERMTQLYNRNKLRLRIILSGREIVVQSINIGYREPEKIIYLLPYYINEIEDLQIIGNYERILKENNFKENELPEFLTPLYVEEEETKEKKPDLIALKKYSDIKDLLKEDKRDTWWQQYSVLKHKKWDKLPKELNFNKLSEITTQPLLNYLVALSYIRGKLDFSKASNVNEIYEDLIKGVYNRGYEKREHSTIKGMSYDNFTRILEEISLATWQSGASRGSTTESIHNYVKNSRLEALFQIFIEGAKQGISRLLAAFYFRQKGMENDGSKTFEFTHKSFGEYLLAKRLVRTVNNIHENRNQFIKNYDRGWDENQCLLKFFQTVKKAPITIYIKEYLTNEFQLISIRKLKKWQQTLIELFEKSLLQGFPSPDIRKSHIEERDHYKNAEETLLVLINCIASVTRVCSEINWNIKDRYSFSRFISRTLQARTSPKELVIMSSLTWQKMENLNIYVQDLYGADFSNSIFEDVEFHLSNLQFVKFRNCKLKNVDFWQADCREASFENASFIDVKFKETILQQVLLTKKQISNSIGLEYSLLFVQEEEK